MYDEPTCRLCLSTEGLLEKIFTSPDMVMKIFECTNIVVKEVKGLPTCICEICRSEIIIWQKFKRQCLKTEDFLTSKYPEFFVEEKEGRIDSGLHRDSDCERLRDSDIELPGDSDTELPRDSDPEQPRDSDEYNEEIENVEYIEDIEFDNACEDENDPEEHKDCIEIKLLDVKFEALEEDDLEREIRNSDTVEVIPVEEHVDGTGADLNATKSDEEITKIGKKAKSKCGEVWKTSDGGRVKYHTRCQVCGKLQQNIKQHMLVHTNELPFQCPYCKRGFRQKSNFKHHVYIHTGEKPYKCKLCDKAFSDPASLRSHMIQHTGERRYSCEVCGKAFGHSHTLAAHKRIHTQDRRHSCEFCSKKFLSKHALKKHVRTHTGERPYQCDQCPKTFSTSGNLSTHKRVHTKERPYQCSICGLDFAYKCVLNTHMKRHESKSDSEEVLECEYEENI